ncbi:MAG: FtsQ-type POTRA domain-containing protein [Deltaproteobacteria bacterium]|nr:FtsQ-type POTRA domain-containing protein [Deltaproteobacteria bacterium]
MRDASFSKPVKKQSNRRKKRKSVFSWKAGVRFGLAIVAYLVSFAVVGSGVFFGGKEIMKSEIFCLENIHIENNRRLAGEQLLALGEVMPGMNLFEIDPDEVGLRIEQLPWVRSARVERQFPHDLRIHIEERTAKAIVKLDHFYYVDSFGELFKVLEAGDSLDYPVISGIERSRFLSDPENSKRLLMKALALLQAMEGRDSFGPGDVSEIHVGEQDGIYVFSCPGGIPIRFGKDDFAGKLDRLEKVYPQIKPRLSYLKHVDLNVLDRVVVKFDPRRMR